MSEDEKPCKQIYSPIPSKCRHKWIKIHEPKIFIDLEKRTWEVNNYFCDVCASVKSTKSRYR